MANYKIGKFKVICVENGIGCKLDFFKIKDERAFTVPISILEANTVKHTYLQLEKS